MRSGIAYASGRDRSNVMESRRNSLVLTIGSVLGCHPNRDLIARHSLVSQVAESYNPAAWACAGYSIRTFAASIKASLSVVSSG
jgi:hypothetical protein